MKHTTINISLYETKDLIRLGKEAGQMVPSLRDWSLITGRGGGLQNGKIAGPKLFAPPPSRQGKTFHTPPFKGWKLFVPPPLQYD